MKTRTKTCVARRTASKGLSLVELLVAMGIGLILTLAITTVLINSERVKLTSTKLNAASQTGAYASLVMDRDIRNAGSGFTQSRDALGCQLDASRVVAGLTLPLLPPPAPLPVPFDNIAAGTPISLAPVVIIDGAGVNGSDQIVVMAGTHGFGETPRTVSPGSATGASLVVDNAAGMINGDMVLVSLSGDRDVISGRTCMLQQQGDPIAQSLPMAGPYFSPTGATGTTLASYGAVGGVVVASLGSISPVAGERPNPPTFKIYGVGEGSRLFSYDLLNTVGAAEPAAETVAEGVFTMHALYGIGTPSVSVAAGAAQPARVPLAWAAPVGAALGIDALWPAVGARPIASRAARTTLETIQAVRVAMVLQSNLQERDPAPGEARATPATELVLFPDLPPAQQVRVPLTPAQQNFRYRIVDTIIPVRNI